MSDMVTVWRDKAGATAVEFALIAPVFLGFVFLMIAGGQMIWTQQVLTEVAANAARCAGLGLTSCSSATTTATYATQRAASFGVRLAAGEVVLSQGQTCHGIAGLSKVTITHSYAFQVPFLRRAPSHLVASACHG